MVNTMLITGCSGFIGIHATEYALAHNYKVVGLDKRDCKINHQNFTFIKADITDKDAVQQAAKGCDIVLHLAAITSLPNFKTDLRSNYEINVNGFTNVIDAACKSKCRKFLYASSSGVYLDEFSEGSLIDIKRQRIHYSKSKLMNEMIADSYRDVHGMEPIGLRFFNFYGPGEEEKDNVCALTTFLLAKKNNEQIVLFGDGNQSRDFVYITDGIKIIFMLLEKADGGIYNIGTGVATTLNQIADLVDKGSKKYIPNPLELYRAITKADTRKLLKTIGEFRFVSVEEGIEKMKAYYRI